MKFYILAMAFFSMPTFASDQVPDFNQQAKSEWKLLGPAFSKHASLNGAPIIKQATFKEHCYVYDYGLAFSIDRCTFEVDDSQRKWSETNPAIGIEMSTTSSTNPNSKNKIFASFVHDSYGSPSLLVGAGKQWSVASMGSFNLSAGISGGLWNRTVAENKPSDKTCGTLSTQYLNFDSFTTNDVCFNRYEKEKFLSVDVPNQVTSLKRVTVPFVLPYIEIVEAKTGLGVNIALAPKIKIGRYETVPTTTLMMQITYRLDF